MQTLYENYGAALPPNKLNQAAVDTNLYHRWDIITRYIPVTQGANNPASQSISNNVPVTLSSTQAYMQRYRSWKLVAQLTTNSNALNAVQYKFGLIMAYNNVGGLTNTHSGNQSTYTTGVSIKLNQNFNSTFGIPAQNSVTYWARKGFDYTMNVEMYGLSEYGQAVNNAGQVTYRASYTYSNVTLSEWGSCRLTPTIINQNNVRVIGVNIFTNNTNSSDTSVWFRGWWMGQRYTTA